MIDDATNVALAKHCSKVAHDARELLGCHGVVVIAIFDDGRQHMGTCKLDPIQILRLMLATSSSLANQATRIDLPLADPPAPPRANA